MNVSIIYIGATWCGPCRQFKPRLNKFAESHDIKVDYLDATNDADKVSNLGVESVPTTIFVSEGIERGRIVGVASNESLEAMLEQSAVPCGSA